jgi:hypothetical protein
MLELDSFNIGVRLKSVILILSCRPEETHLVTGIMTALFEISRHGETTAPPLLHHGDITTAIPLPQDCNTSATPNQHPVAP